MPVIGERPDLNLKSIVFATDFSVCSEYAGLYAVRLARYFSATLLVAHAYTPSQAAMEAEVDPRLKSKQRKDLQSNLAKTAFNLASGISIESVPALLYGDPHEMIPQLVVENAPSILVLGTHGGGRIERGLIGSVAERVLRSTSWPSLTVGPKVSSPMAFPFERILYATDFTPAAAHAAIYALSFAESFGAKIDVLNVIRADAVHHPDRLSDLQKHFYGVLDRLVPERAREFSDPRTFVGIGKAHDQIMAHIRERSVDLLVLGIRKTSHLGMEARRSGAFQLIVDAKCPVLTITG